MHKSTISKKINLLYMTVGPSLYTYYSAREAYLHAMYPIPNNVDEVPNLTACTNDNKRTAAKISHTFQLKMQNNVINMNAALIKTLLSLILMAIKLLHKQEQMMNPNSVFRQCLIGLSSSTDALWPKATEPIGWQWLPTGTPQWGLRYSPCTSFVALLLQAFQDTRLWTSTLYIFVCVSSTARDSSPRNTRCGSSVATTPAKMNNFVSFKTFWENAVQIPCKPAWIQYGHN
jgi:hypothetical protein